MLVTFGRRQVIYIIEERSQQRADYQHQLSCSGTGLTTQGTEDIDGRTSHDCAFLNSGQTRQDGCLIVYHDIGHPREPSTSYPSSALLITPFHCQATTQCIFHSNRKHHKLAILQHNFRKQENL